MSEVAEVSTSQKLLEVAYYSLANDGEHHLLSASPLGALGPAPAAPSDLESWLRVYNYLTDGYYRIYCALALRVRGGLWEDDASLAQALTGLEQLAWGVKRLARVLLSTISAEYILPVPYSTTLTTLTPTTRRLTPSASALLCTVLAAVAAGDERRAHEAYLAVSVGSSTYTLGVSETAQHARRSRDLVERGAIAHLLDDPWMAHCLTAVWRMSESVVEISGQAVDVGVVLGRLTSAAMETEIKPQNSST